MSVRTITLDGGVRVWLVTVPDPDHKHCQRTEVLTRNQSGAFFQRFVGWKPTGTSDFNEAVKAAGGSI